MNIEELEVGIVHLDGEVVVVLRGELDAASADDLDEHVRPLTGRYDGSQMTLDFTEVTAIDADGREALLAIGRIPRDTGRVRVHDPDGLVRATLGDEADELFKISDDLSSTG